MRKVDFLTFVDDSETRGTIIITIIITIIMTIIITLRYEF